MFLYQHVFDGRWIVSAISLVAGAFVGFFFGWLKDRLKEGRENDFLREAIYQELANNLEVLLYLSGPRMDYIIQTDYDHC
jgi:hypothetical protein